MARRLIEEVWPILRRYGHSDYDEPPQKDGYGMPLYFARPASRCRAISLMRRHVNHGEAQQKALAEALTQARAWREAASKNISNGRDESPASWRKCSTIARREASVELRLTR